MKGETRQELSEKQYRAIERDSYSSLSLFSKSRKKYLERYILGGDDETPSHAMILGNIVDCKLFTPLEFEDRFGVSKVAKTTEQMFDFADELYKLTIKCLSIDGEVSRPLKDLMEEAFTNVKYDINGNEIKFKKKDFNWLILNFTGSNAEVFYKERRDNFGKQVIGINQEEQALNLLRDARNTEWTASILNLETDERFEVLNQLKFDDFQIEGLDIKFMSDKVILDHKLENIQPYDLKVTFVGDNFAYQYKKARYYLQAGLYNEGIKAWISKERPELEKYILLPMKFIVLDSTRQSRPLIFATNEKHIKDALEGFDINGFHYKGVKELAREILWHRDMDIWDISLENFEKQGIIEMSNFDEKQEE